VVFFSRFLTHLLARIDNKEKNFGNQEDFKIRQAQSLRGGTLLDPAGGRGGDHAAPSPFSAPHLLATFFSCPPLSFFAYIQLQICSQLRNFVI